jgi:hypothetical protein
VTGGGKGRCIFQIQLIGLVELDKCDRHVTKRDLVSLAEIADGLEGTPAAQKRVAGHSGLLADSRADAGSRRDLPRGGAAGDDQPRTAGLRQLCQMLQRAQRLTDVNRPVRRLVIEP